ncbi:type IV inositol polyphosphate 5-phosphatase 7 [Amborella trichopoda]|uniref:type IV inositol polyphosphate 5-phosphatase 7 n=1 Tax=Amborella trichopoda TaxID=13333 RepID=UPI0005D3C02A|nr:type IV inositol polyphosphate 5-phosphatase 7 [Amborella trichopoda]|eukprot:XP_011625152.1 type IV inositol polyphosphate 5-phosphatase 7 [Amborella trichopoda]
MDDISGGEFRRPWADRIQDVECSLHDVRVLVGTWNVAGRAPVDSLVVDLEEWLNFKTHPADIYVLGFQEVVPLRARNVLGVVENGAPAAKWNSLIPTTLEQRHGSQLRAMTPLRYGRRQRDEEVRGFFGLNYACAASRQLVGIFVTVWAKVKMIEEGRVSGVEVFSVGCGMMGYLGNKGAVSVSLCIEGTSFCFVGVHLASGEKTGDEARRNRQVSKIFRRTAFLPRLHDRVFPLPQTIMGHDRIFWFGDLNYRLLLADGLARNLIKQQDWKALHQFDQLKKEQSMGGVFDGWREGNIEFAPTYKYSTSNSNRYSGGNPNRTGEKQRTPAWCDRIMWYGKGVQQLSYVRSESGFSDHRPVSAFFSTQVDSQHLYLQPLKFRTQLQSLSGGGKGNEEKTTLLALLVRDMESSRRQDLPPLESFL